MKKIFTFLLVMTAMGSMATTYNISVTNFQFSPANLPNVLVGDIIKFNFGGPNFHNATTMPLGMVPAGAAPIYSGTPGSVTGSYSYTVTKSGSYRYYCEIHSGDGVTGMVGTFTASGVVPVELRNFDVNFSGNMVQASWQTASEQNIDHFSLQKSTDGKNYVEAARVPSNGNADHLQSYHCNDAAPGKAARYIYYLLKTINKDGSFSLSPVKLVRNENALKKIITQIATNPVSKATGHLMFQFNADKNGSMKAWVVNESGTVVMKLDLSASKGINNGHIHMAELPTGMYTVVFSLEGLKESHKVLLVE